mgnify:CR=1 FL=1
MIKNISKAEVLVLKDQVAYQEGQVVSKTLAQNDALSVTLFSFEIIFVYKYFKTFFQIYSIKKVENFQLDFYNYSGLIQFFLSN